MEKISEEEATQRQKKNKGRVWRSCFSAGDKIRLTETNQVIDDRRVMLDVWKRHESSVWSFLPPV